MRQGIPCCAGACGASATPTPPARAASARFGLSRTFQFRSLSLALWPTLHRCQSAAGQSQPLLPCLLSSPPARIAMTSGAETTTRSVAPTICAAAAASASRAEPRRAEPRRAEPRRRRRQSCACTLVLCFRPIRLRVCVRACFRARLCVHDCIRIVGGGGGADGAGAEL